MHSRSSQQGSRAARSSPKNREVWYAKECGGSFSFCGVLSAVLGFSSPAHAILVNNGNGLIYDTGLNITWYDYTYTGRQGTGATWSQATALAAGLTVGGTTAGSWTLPRLCPSMVPRTIGAFTTMVPPIGATTSAPPAAPIPGHRERDGLPLLR